MPGNPRDKRTKNKGLGNSLEGEGVRRGDKEEGEEPAGHNEILGGALEEDSE